MRADDRRLAAGQRFHVSWRCALGCREGAGATFRDAPDEGLRCLVLRSAKMARHEKTLERLLSGEADANIGFEDLCNLLRTLGFTERSRGSHRVFRCTGIEEMINLQREGSKAKPYQVKQVRAVILKYHLGES